MSEEKDTYTVEDSPLVIYLAPECEKHGDERTWATTDIWDGACCECGSPSIKYVRAATRKEHQTT